MPPELIMGCRSKEKRQTEYVYKTIFGEFLHFHVGKRTANHRSKVKCEGDVSQMREE